ncbi:MAG: thrombospondin type 3 repeat-containing protein [Poseidonia sp.]
MQPVKGFLAFGRQRLAMRSRSKATVTALTALLLLSVLSSMMPPAISERLDDRITMEASGRSASPEVFISSGGSPNGDELPGAIAVINGGYVVGGDYNRTITFGSHTLAATSPFSNGNEFFLAGISETGTWTYLANADHSQGSVSFLTDVAGSMGNAVAAGYMYGPVSFGSTTVSTSVLDGFIGMTGPTGNWMWATAFQTLPNASTDLSIPQAMAVDATGDILVAGYFSGETDFGGTSINVSNEEIFIAKLDGANGALKWVISGGGIGPQRVTDIMVDAAGDIHVAGITQNNVLFGTTSYSTAGTQDSFVLKVSTAGAVLGITGYGIANQAITISEIAGDSNGNLYLGGTFEGTLARNGWSITANKGGTDIFFIKDSGQASTSWATIGGTNGNDVLSGLVVTSKSEVIFSSYGQNTFTGGTKAVTPKGNLDGILGGLTSSGSWSWMDVTNSNDYEANIGLALNDSDIIATTGAFANNNPATISKGSTTITSTGGWDTYVWSLDPSLKADSDNDGVADYQDNCPTDSNPLQENTDGDAQGDACDADDDNDGITDNSGDDCPRNGQANWQSTQDFNDPVNSTDWDRDGCKDGVEDNDMDNDGVENANDACPRSTYQPPRPTWTSDAVTDIDGDGCRDADEDDDDDGDGLADVSDDCPTVVGNSTLGEEGCLDSDGDGWSNNFDDCPNQAGNSTLGGKNACPDNDGDGWADIDDAFDEDPSQWADADGDGYGDNPAGTTPDDCTDVSGTSTEDRLGCLDTDGDGYSDPDTWWDPEAGADAFHDDPTQWSDFDGDGYGDNYANTTWEDRNPSWPGEYNPDVAVQDACPTQEGTSWQNGMIGCPDQDGDGWYNLQDAFPNDATQWEDSDGDGYGDNPDGNDADDCPTVAGTSTFDRLGCADSDGDGYSDPEISWTPADGADAFMADPTQWADQDNDFFGDNPAGERPDACPAVRGTSFIDRFGCEDSDGDGISNADTFWALEQGADACPLTYGNSSADRIGCVDTDGDNYSDPTPDWKVAQGADAYPEDASRWILEPEAESSLLASPAVLIGGVGGLLALLALGGFLMRGRKQDEAMDFAVTQLNMEMPPMTAQPMMGQPAYATQPGYGAPVTQQPAVVQPAYAPPVVQPDPAREYYNGLIAQGYPHEDAVRYTQQYFAEFYG